MKYKLVATLDSLHPRKWKTLGNLIENEKILETIEYLKKRCAVDGYTIDSEDDTDDEIFNTGTYRMTYRDMMCEEVFLYALV